MAVKRYTEMQADFIREGAERRLGYTDNLMMVIIDFDDGPLFSRSHHQFFPGFNVMSKITFPVNQQACNLLTIPLIVRIINCIAGDQIIELSEN